MKGMDERGEEFCLTRFAGQIDPADRLEGRTGERFRRVVAGAVSVMATGVMAQTMRAVRHKE